MRLKIIVVLFALLISIPAKSELAAQCNFNTSEYISELSDLKYLENIEITVYKYKKWTTNLMKALLDKKGAILPKYKKKFDAKIFAKLIEEQGVTTCFAVPTMLFALLEELEKTPRDVSSLEVISTGGAPVPPELVHRVRESLGCHLLTAFGQTEHSPMISLNPLESTLEQIIETAGQPLPHTEVSIRAVENNQMVPVDCVGEICARSYGIMLRYNDNEGATSAAIDPDGWLHTGDLGTIDKDGFIRVTGRIKDMIIKGGENYFPAEIEATLIMNPDIIQVSVVGLPDHKWGEIIAAFFISNSTVNIKNLRDHCRKNLSPQKTPSTWVRVLEFPLTASGKIQKFSLREKYLEGNYGEKLEF